MSSAENLQASNDSERLDRVIDEIITAQRSSIKPTLVEFLSRYPEFADELRDLFPALIAAEKIDSAVNRPSRRERTIMDGVFPDRLGDFELLNEIGRGGMGVVFAARQISTGMNVAVKMLSRHLCNDAKVVQRFLRESESTGRLSHPNIIPLFQKGSIDGISFYAMQLIDGKDLAQLLGAARGGNVHELSVNRAADHRSAYRLEARDRFVNLLRRSRRSDPAEEMYASNSNNESKEANTGDLNMHYRTVASLMSQVAKALDYAHRQGCIHRDIKPSNLILDRLGKIWISDFGLAKFETDEDLTRTGDILGTLRYVAPEQLEGVASPLCDIYGLGATLYEMVTLQPAFGDSGYARLLNRIRSSTPTRPQYLDDSIPKELETIITAAMHREPTARYRSAGEMAQDLDRFCQGKRVKTRQVSGLRSAWYWVRRNRLTAAAMLAVWALTAVVIPMLMLFNSVRLRDEVHRAQAAEASYQQQLVESLILSARAVRSLGQIESRTQSIAALQQANQLFAQVEMDVDDRDDFRQRLRAELAATLALPDFQAEPALPIHGSFDRGRSLLAMSGETLVYVDRFGLQGQIEICHRSDPETVTRQIQIIPDALVLTRNARRLITMSDDVDGLSLLAIWDVATGEQLWSRRIHSHRFSVSGDERTLAFLDKSGFLKLLDLENQTQYYVADFSVVQSGQRLPLIRLDTNARLVAFIYRDHLDVVAIDERDAIASVHPQQSAIEFEDGFWGPKNVWFAAKTHDGLITLYDTNEWRVLRTLVADKIQGTQFSASPEGNYLSSQSWNRRLHLWDVRTGVELLNVKTTVAMPFLTLNEMRIGPVFEQNEAVFWTMVPSKYFQRHVGSLNEMIRPESFTIDPMEGRLGISMAESTQLYMTNNDDATLLKLDKRLFEPMFDQTGFLWGIDRDRLCRYQVVKKNAEVSVHETFRLENVNVTCFGIDGTGETLAVNPYGGITMFRRQDNATEIKEFKAFGDVRRIQVSPDGQWVVGSSHNEAGCFVFDTNSEEQFNLAPSSVLTVPRFSHDGRYLALTLPGDELRLYKTGNWEAPIHTWPKPQSQPAFSPDSRFLAVSFDAESISLLKLNSGELLIRLQHPGGDAPRRISFSNNGDRLFFISSESNSISEWKFDACLQEIERLGF